MCDRRIWQSAIFDKFIFNRKKDDIVLAKVMAWVYNHNKIFKIDSILSKKMTLDIGGKIKTVNLVYDAIRNYLWYLSLIGFIQCEEYLYYYESYKVTPKTLSPPNINDSKKFRDILSNLSSINPNIDEIIYDLITTTINIPKFRRSHNFVQCTSKSNNTDNLVHTDNIYDDDTYAEKLKKRQEEREQRRINGYNEIIKNFNKDILEVFRDSYNYRWLHCTKCGEIKREDDMASYQYSKGECRDCSRLASTR